MPGTLTRLATAATALLLLPATPALALAEPQGVSVTGVAVVEGDSGTTQAQVTVSLTAALPTTASVAFTTQPFGAVPHVAEAGSDYQASSGRVTFDPGATTRTVSITIINDTIAEPTEYFAVALSDPAGTDIAAGLASVTITEDPPETDAFDQAQPVQESSPAGGDDNAAFVSLYGATRDRPIGRGPEVWYSYTPPGDGTATLDVTVDNSGTCTPAATIVVYHAGPDLATLTERHVGPCHLVIPVAAGTTYWIAIVPEQQLPTPDLNWLTITRTPSPSLIALTITPAQASVDLPTPQQFAVTGTLGDGTHIDARDRVTWTSANPSVARIDASGAATPLRPGSTTITATAAATPAISASATLTVNAPAAQEVAYSSTAAGYTHLFTAAADGTGQRQLTSGAALDTGPAYSPDGTRIAFSTTRTGNGDLYTVKTDGTGLTRITSSAALETEPAWSPDGTRLAYSSTAAGYTHLFTAAADGTGQRQLTSGAALDTGPAYSPDGTRIAFSTTRTGNGDLYTVKTDGTGLTRITSSAALETEPAWSPDGTRLAYSSTAAGYTHLFTAAANGTGQRQLTSGAALDTGPAYSPDGTRIAFSTTRTGNGDLYTVKTDGTGLTRITSSAALETEPAWSPAP